MSIRVHPWLDQVTLLRAVLAVFIATLYGISDEWHQSFVPGRTPEWADVLADAVGAMLGVSLVCALSASRARRATQNSER